MGNDSASAYVLCPFNLHLFQFQSSKESGKVLEQASRVFKSIFELQNYKVNYSLNTRSPWWGMGSVAMARLTVNRLQ